MPCGGSASDNAELQAIRRDALAIAATERGQQAAAEANARLGASYRAMADTHRSQEMIFAATAADRREWEAITEQPRRLAIAADAELRRRHPEQVLEPLRSAEPEPVTEAELSGLLLTPEGEIARHTAWIADLTTQRAAFAEKLAGTKSLTVAAVHPGNEDLGPAFEPFGVGWTDAILRPPMPVIKPAQEPDR